MDSAGLLRRVILTALVMMLLAGATALPASAKLGTWVVLDSGRDGQYAWSVRATGFAGSAEAGSQDATRPCLLVRAKWQLGPYNFRGSRYRQCADAATVIAPTAAPLIATGAPPSSGPHPKLTAVGMILAPAVRDVTITLSDGQTSTISAESLAGDRSKRESLGRFRFAAFSVGGPWCAIRISTMSATGRTLWEGDVDAPC